MAVAFRNYAGGAGIGEDYFKVRSFLVRRGYSEFAYARWDWMITHPYLEPAALPKIGLWEEGGAVVAAALFDCRPGEAFCLALPEYADLKRDALLYARERLAGEEAFGVYIPDGDADFQAFATSLGLRAGEERELDAVFRVGKTSTEYRLPDGFSVTDMQETFDLCQYRRVLYKGFNHELKGQGAFRFSPEDARAAEREMLRPNVDLRLKVAIVAPDGNFASYCGMWYDEEAGFAFVEPVATDPAYRRLGLGRAAVLEGIARVGARGAKTAIVGSSQPFYYSIGFQPYAASTLWK